MMSFYRHSSPQPRSGSGSATRSLRWLRWLPWTVFLTYASFIVCVVWVMDTGRGKLIRAFVDTHAYSDKLAHCVLMGTLCLLLNIALAAPTVRILNRPVLRGSLWLSVIIALEELSQLYVPYRTFDLVDLLADLLGIVIAGAIARRLVQA